MTIVQSVGILVVCVGFALLYRQRNIHNERTILEHRFYETQALCANADPTIRIVAISQLYDMTFYRRNVRFTQGIDHQYPFVKYIVELFSEMLVVETNEEIISTLTWKLNLIVDQAQRTIDGDITDYLRGIVLPPVSKAEFDLVRLLAGYWQLQNKSQIQLMTEEIEALIHFPMYGSSSSLHEKSARQKYLLWRCEMQDSAFKVKTWTKIQEQKMSHPNQQEFGRLYLIEIQNAVNQFMALKSVMFSMDSHILAKATLPPETGH